MCTSTAIGKRFASDFSFIPALSLPSLRFIPVLIPVLILALILANVQHSAHPFISVTSGLEQMRIEYTRGVYFNCIPLVLPLIMIYSYRFQRCTAGIEVMAIGLQHMHA